MYLDSLRTYLYVTYVYKELRMYEHTKLHTYIAVHQYFYYVAINVNLIYIIYVFVILHLFILKFI